MNKKKITLKSRLLCSLTAAVVCAASLNLSAFAEETRIAISEYNFPDPAFREYIRTFDRYKGEQDGYLDLPEYSSIHVLAPNDLGIRSLKGIEYLTEITTLNCQGNYIEDIDLSKLVNLKSLDCSDNNLKALDVSQNKVLEYLNCSDNELTSLDVGENTALERLFCRNNFLKNLYVSKNENLKDLYCSGNNLETLDLGNVTSLMSLKRLECYENKLTTLDTTRCKELEELKCYDNNLTTLNVGKNMTLKNLYCYNNNIKNLDVSGCSALTILECYENNLTNIDITGCTALTNLICYENKLTTIDIRSCTALKKLDCRNNYISDYWNEGGGIIGWRSNWNTLHIDFEPQKSGEGNIETNTALSSLKINGASVAGFNPDTTAYIYNVSYANWNSNKTQTYTITATPSKNTSTVSISKNNFALTSTYSDNDSTEDVTVIVTAEGEEKTTYTITFTVLACPHTNKTITDSTLADCTNDGFEEYTCPDCGKTDRKTLTALGHDWSTEWAIDIPANCTTDGSKSHHCTRTGCDAKNDVTVINALGHSWSFWTKVGDTDNYTRTCSRDNCGANETKTATEIDHTHVFDGATESITAATCTTRGLQKRYCSVESCPEYIEEDVDKIAHTPCAPEVTNSTCTTEGSSIIKCSVCGEILSTTILDKAEHNYGAWESDANGHWKSCIVCLVPSEKTAHSENDGIVTTPATSSTSGIKTYSCNDCGRELRTEVIPATGDVAQPTYPPSSTPSAPSTSSGTTVSTSEPMLENGSGQGGWSSIEKYVANAESGSTVYVDMNGTTLLPKNILNKLLDRNVNLVLKMNDNITWTINGKSVEKSNDINMNVKLNTKNIPTNVISSVSDGNDVIQLSLSHDGSFGFNAVITVTLGTKYNGKFANLMYYNPKTEELEFVDASTVASGKATLNFSHASDYAIVIGNTPMTAYEDVSSGAASNYDTTEISLDNRMTYFISIILLIGTAFITVFIFKNRVKK